MMRSVEDQPAAAAGAAAPDSTGQRRVLGMALIIVSSVGISFGGLIARNIETAGAWQINIYRSFSVAAVVAVVLLWQYKGSVGGKLIQIGRPGLVGACLLTVAGAAFLQALTTTTVANTLFTLCAIPFITAALAWIFLREGLDRITIATMVCAGMGVAVMLGDGIGGGSLYGNLMALATAMGFSGYAVIVRRHRSIDMQPCLLLGALMLALVALLVTAGDWSITWWDLAMCFLWGGILSGIGNILFIIASRHLLAAEVTLFMLLEFSLGPIWVWLFIDEVPTVLTLAGGAIIMGAVLVRTVYQVRVSQTRLRRGRLAGPV